MGHTRLGAIPKSRKWNEVVEQVTGAGLAGGVTPGPADVGAIAAQTLDAAQKALDRATDDPGVRYTFYLLTQVALAARDPDWGAALTFLTCWPMDTASCLQLIHFVNSHRPATACSWSDSLPRINLPGRRA
jgi:hypothetical protein